jgi:hypothetical protein
MELIKSQRLPATEIEVQGTYQWLARTGVVVDEVGGR